MDCTDHRVASSLNVDYLFVLCRSFSLLWRIILQDVPNQLFLLRLGLCVLIAQPELLAKRKDSQVISDLALNTDKAALRVFSWKECHSRDSERIDSRVTNLYTRFPALFDSPSHTVRLQLYRIRAAISPEIFDMFVTVRGPAACAIPQLIADAGRRSAVRGSNAVVNREEKESVLSQELSSARKPFLHIYFPWFSTTLLWITSSSVCLLRQSLSRWHPPGVTLPALTHCLLWSSIFFSVSFISKRVRKRRAFVQSTHELRLYESIIRCAHWKPTQLTRRSARPPPTPRN